MRRNYTLEGWPTMENVVAAAVTHTADRMRHEQTLQGPTQTLQPISVEDRSHNPMRPWTFNEVIGQERAVRLMRRVVSAANRRGQPLDHVLLTGAAGTGKTTFANVIAHELRTDCYQVAAPVPLDTLLALRETIQPNSVLFVDEIHMQAVMERRGKEAATQPEVFLHLLEDSVIATNEGMLSFPPLTVIGATTDPGRLPDPFLDRFPLQPRLDPYTVPELAEMAVWDTQQIKLKITIEAAQMFAEAARGTPRMVNRYVTNAASLLDDSSDLIYSDIAHEVLADLNGVTGDGLSPDQQAMLVFLYTKGRREKADGEVIYQASVSTLATGIGLSRDQKAIQLRVEPYLIAQGYVQVAHGGRLLTDAGIKRAQGLVNKP